MVADVDLDSNGEISFDEFCIMMEKDSAGILGGAVATEGDRTLPEVWSEQAVESHGYERECTPQDACSAPIVYRCL